jgi:hypothetical protein
LSRAKHNSRQLATGNWQQHRSVGDHRAMLFACCKHKFQMLL